MTSRQSTNRAFSCGKQQTYNKYPVEHWYTKCCLLQDNRYSGRVILLYFIRWSGNGARWMSEGKAVRSIGILRDMEYRLRDSSDFHRSGHSINEID